MELGSKSPSRNQAGEGLKSGTVGFAESSPIKGTISVSYPFHAKTVDVLLLPSSTEKEKRAVRGTFQVTLPQLKRIQMELDYDLIQDDSNDPNTADFFVEVYEQSSQSATGWVKSADFHEKPEKKTREMQYVLAIRDEKGMGEEQFTAHSFIANLTKFAGKEVLITLAAESSKESQKFIRGRWLQARLVGSTFDYKIVPIQENEKEDESQK